MYVINMFGPPGCGKSSAAAGLFYIMKTHNFNVELVTEYAKDLTWSDRQSMLSEQDYIFAKQNHRLRRLIGKVDFAITDSPLILSEVYIPKDYPKSFSVFVLDMFNTYHNINIFIDRAKPYTSTGRNQTEVESNALGIYILHMLGNNKIPYVRYDGDENIARNIFEYILEYMQYGK